MKVKKFIACRRGTEWKIGLAIQTVERINRRETVEHGWCPGDAWAKAFPGTTADTRLGDYTEVLDAATLKDAKVALVEVVAAWSRAVMERAKTDDAVTIVVTKDELQMLLHGVDSHRYWNLSDTEYRHDGFVREPGSDDPETAEQIAEYDDLEAKLEAIKREVEAGATASA